MQSDHISFSPLHTHYAVSFIDIVGSTGIIAELSASEGDVLYMTFLNSISDIITKGGGEIIKTMGDGIMYYFPQTENGELKEYERVLRIALDVLFAHTDINASLHERGLPPIDYRVSSSFGAVSIIESDAKKVNDLFGTTVNTCAKMNKLAAPNSCIIGSALYGKVKDSVLFTIHPYKEFVIDNHLSYMTYVVEEK